MQRDVVEPEPVEPHHVMQQRPDPDPGAELADAQQLGVGRRVVGPEAARDREVSRPHLRRRQQPQLDVAEPDRVPALSLQRGDYRPAQRLGVEPALRQQHAGTQSGQQQQEDGEQHRADAAHRLSSVAAAAARPARNRAP